MRAYIVPKGARIYTFTQESFVRGKCETGLLDAERIYYDVVIDPVRVANGHALDPDLWYRGFSWKAQRAAEKGYSVFSEPGSIVMTMVKTEKMQVV